MDHNLNIFSYKPPWITSIYIINESEQKVTKINFFTIFKISFVTTHTDRSQHATIANEIQQNKSHSYSKWECKLVSLNHILQTSPVQRSGSPRPVQWCAFVFDYGFHDLHFMDGPEQTMVVTWSKIHRNKRMKIIKWSIYT